MPSLARQLCCLIRPRIQIPADLRRATATEWADLLPYSYPILSYRNRSFESRGVQVALSAVQEGKRTRWVHNVHLWLEDMDTLAADVAALHSDYRDGTKGLVTAFMDELCWVKYQPLPAIQPSNYSTSGAPLGTSLSSGDLGVENAEMGMSPQRRDMRLCGQVTWVGKSSIEVTLELHELPLTESCCSLSEASRSEREPEEVTLVALSRFVMAARTADFKKSVVVDALLPSSKEDVALFQLGALNQQERLNRRQLESAHEPLQPLERDAISQKLGPLQSPVVLSLLELSMSRTVPRESAGAKAASSGEVAATGGGGETATNSGGVATRNSGEVASKNSGGLAATSGGVAAASSGGVAATSGGVSAKSSVEASEVRKPSETELHSIYDATWDDRNTTGATIFGGHLLRLGYEHAVEVAELFADGVQLDLVHMSEVQFLSPVPVGCTLHLWGRVVFVEGDKVHVHVRAARTDAAPSDSRAVDGTDDHLRHDKQHQHQHQNQQHMQVGQVNEHGLRLREHRMHHRPHRPNRPHHFQDPFPHLVKVTTNGFWFVFKLPDANQLGGVLGRTDSVDCDVSKGGVAGSNHNHLHELVPESVEDVQRYLYAFRKHRSLHATCAQL